MFTEKDCEESRRKEGGKDGSVFSIYYAYSNLYVLIPIIICFSYSRNLKQKKWYLASSLLVEWVAIVYQLNLYNFFIQNFYIRITFCVEFFIYKILLYRHKEANTDLSFFLIF